MLNSGDRIGPSEVGLLAAVGVTMVKVCHICSHFLAPLVNSHSDVS